MKLVYRWARLTSALFIYAKATRVILRLARQDPMLKERELKLNLQTRNKRLQKSRKRKTTTQ